jgi:ribosomal protein S18 acetylase RimI-like enzyme
MYLRLPMEHTLIIRRAMPDDLPMLMRFEQGVIFAERYFDPTLRRREVRYYDFGTMLQDPNVYIVVAESDGQLVGSGYARIEPAKQYNQHERYAYLGFMYVLPEHRGRGINQRVMEHLEGWVAAQGLTELRLEVYADNEPAIRSYEKTGFQPLLVTMRKGMQDGSLEPPE